AHDPACPAWRAQTLGERARGAERDLLCPVDRMPMEGVAKRPAPEKHSARLSRTVELGRYIGAHPSCTLCREANPTETPSNDPLSGATIEFRGRSFDVFGFEMPAPGELSCEAFLTSITSEKVAANWGDIIRSLILAARRGDFRENRRLIASPDKSRFF